MIIGTFLGPFLLTFITVTFLLVMQFIWKHVDDFMGKGLEWYVIAELLLYATANLVTMALPLAILLSSIMTFGALSEQYELVAMKSAGMSLMRILYPIFVFVFLLSVGAFFFGNNVAPQATLKFRTLLYDITQKKPALELKAGVFYNEIDGYSIRVAEKDDNTGELTDVLIYDHTENHPPNKKVIRAEKGRMLEDPGYLVMELENGVSYDLSKSKEPTDQEESDLFLRQTFERQIIRFDLSSFGFERSDEDIFKNSHQMLPISGLKQKRDSLQGVSKRRYEGFDAYVQRVFYPLRDTLSVEMAEAKGAPLYSHASEKKFKRAFDLALNFSKNTRAYVNRYNAETKNRTKHINRFISEIHAKYGYGLACILLFFIGAPLGAIIKKGGLGLPVVFSIMFFLIFHILSITGKKTVVGDVSYAAWGMWIATYVLSPIAILLTYKSNRDSSLFDSVYYTKIWNAVKSLIKR